ncbi:flagellar hook capping protein [Lachnospiraceae bacterium JC7]|nr:flagellar hook capping protein [Lachnospiraceae bacterium JC7]
MAEVSGVSSSSSPYVQKVATPEPNEKNTLTISSYFKLLAAQLANQDYTNPMDNSEMLAQMSQMAMVQSLTSMTESVESQIAFAQQSYSVGMIGKEITVVTEPDAISGQSAETRTGTVEAVYLADDEPVIRLSGDTTDYKISQIVSIRNTGSGSATGPSGTVNTTHSGNGPVTVDTSGSGPVSTDNSGGGPGTI